jgi:hypothetical protein
MAETSTEVTGDELIVRDSEGTIIKREYIAQPVDPTLAVIAAALDP